ncbi:Protein of unknown function [Pyronema omphalodes CBS 100304]|uniref:Uncharacterized protein n=1 Tax=Pyronema omphalodes (strain CBS 100304) TaxID=1076935 RepID=U4LE83_PYROM|nr:Protein of unknown function [Pyronema omphalodes CBS 100304]
MPGVQKETISAK